MLSAAPHLRSSSPFPAARTRPPSLHWQSPASFSALVQPPSQRCPGRPALFTTGATQHNLMAAQRKRIILVPVDDSDACEYSVQWALQNIVKKESADNPPSRVASRLVKPAV